ncbi:MAG: alpha/beta hydrolase, partial [Candidatus Lokiarchaeota archaeon]
GNGSVKDLEKKSISVKLDVLEVVSFEYKFFCPQAELVMFEESGHNPQVEEPSKLFAVIREFLGE